MDTPRQMDPSLTTDFPIFTGGPLYRLQERARLVQAGRRRLVLAALYVVGITWIPLALLSTMEGFAIGPTRLESFLLDFEAAARFLVTVPVFLLTEVLCSDQLRAVVRQFEDAALVVGETRARFRSLVEDTVRLSHSGRAELVLVGLAYLHSLATFVYFLDFQEPTWRLPISNGHHILSVAGGWYFLVAFPIVSFLFLRWLWRIGLWWRFMWRTSKIDLRTSPAHRDGVGGLGFLSESLTAFGGFAFGVTATAAGGLADLIVYEGKSPLQYQWEVGGLIAVLMLVIAGPLLCFVLRLYEAKEAAVFQYGALASRHIQQVDQKWLSGEPLQEDVGIDFRAVAHMGTSVNAVRQMSVVPLYKDDVLKLLVVALLPFLPLLATLVPVNEVVKLLLKLVV